MVDDFRHDPILATKVIFGLDLPPHQQMRLISMWTHNYCFDSSGFGTGKTFTIGLCTALRMMLFEDHVAGILGKTYTGSKIIFGEIEKLASISPIFRNEIKIGRTGNPMIVHGSDACVMTGRNGNQIRALPPDFQKDAERIASESWSAGYFDEWVRYRNYAAFDRVILGRVRKPIPRPDKQDDPIAGHHFFFSGTAQYKWHPAYKRIIHANQQIHEGNPQYHVISFNYTHIPAKYDRLDSTRAAREMMMATMRQDEIQSEIMGVWVDDSVGFYNAKAVEGIRLLDDVEVMAV